MSFNKSAADVLFLKEEYEKAAEMFLEGAREGEDIAAFNFIRLEEIKGRCTHMHKTEPRKKIISFAQGQQNSI